MHHLDVRLWLNGLCKWRKWEVYLICKQQVLETNKFYHHWWLQTRSLYASLCNATGVLLVLQNAQRPVTSGDVFHDRRNNKCRQICSFSTSLSIFGGGAQFRVSRLIQVPVSLLFYQTRPIWVILGICQRQSQTTQAFYTETLSDRINNAYSQVKIQNLQGFIGHPVLNCRLCQLKLYPRATEIIQEWRHKILSMNDLKFLREAPKNL